MIEQKLIQHIRSQFALDWHGAHGASHWARVRANGLRLAETTGAKTHVVELFALLHDARRLNEYHDPQHGHRAAIFAETLTGHYFDLAHDDLVLLQTACRGHSDGHMTGDITVLTCWDADRMDQGGSGSGPRLIASVLRQPGPPP